MILYRTRYCCTTALIVGTIVVSETGWTLKDKLQVTIDSIRSQMTENLQSTTPSPSFQLHIHEWIESQQSAHGVRHDDFAQYHGYCTRRLSRLSHHPDVKKYLVCSSKYASDKAAARGRGRLSYCSRRNDTFSKDEATGKVDVPHISILWYLVVLAERSWAHANMLQKQKKKRQNVLRKLKKATLWAKKLEEIAKDCTDELTQKECQVYTSWMVANLALEKMEYQVRGWLPFCCTVFLTPSKFCRFACNKDGQRRIR